VCKLKHKNPSSIKDEGIIQKTLISIFFKELKCIRNKF
jgi:hypothetical protein